MRTSSRRSKDFSRRAEIRLAARRQVRMQDAHSSPVPLHATGRHRRAISGRGDDDHPALRVVVLESGGGVEGAARQSTFRAQPVSPGSLEGGG